MGVEDWYDSMKCVEVREDQKYVRGTESERSRERCERCERKRGTMKPKGGEVLQGVHSPFTRHYAHYTQLGATKATSYSLTSGN